jgi:hypothetical protein
MIVVGAGTASSVVGLSVGEGTIALAGVAAAGAGAFTATASGAILLENMVVMCNADGGGIPPLYLPHTFSTVLITSGLDTGP